MTDHAGAAHRGRGVLEGAFWLLDVIAGAGDGIGISELARAAGLPKTTTQRLVEQLVAIGAVHRDGQRYLVGELLHRLGSAWRPDPALRAAAEGPLRTLATLTPMAVALTVEHRGEICLVAGTRGVVSDIPPLRPTDTFPTSTAAGRVLLMAAHPPDVEPPAGFSGSEWRRMHATFARSGSVAVEHGEVTPGVSCAAAPVRDRRGTSVAAVSVLAVRRSLPVGTADLLRRASQEITRKLAHP